MSSSTFKNLIYKLRVYKSYKIEDFALNNLPWLICYKTQPNLKLYYINIILYIIAALCGHRTQPRRPIWSDG